jgi:hypothetical protein
MNMNYYAPVNTQPPAEHVPYRNRELDLEAAIAWLSDGLDWVKRDVQALDERISPNEACLTKEYLDEWSEWAENLRRSELRK